MRTSRRRRKVELYRSILLNTAKNMWGLNQKPFLNSLISIVDDPSFSLHHTDNGLQFNTDNNCNSFPHP